MFLQMIPTASCALIAIWVTTTGIFSAACAVLFISAVDELKRPDRDMGVFSALLVMSILCIPALGMALWLQYRCMARLMLARDMDPGD
jgi:hypothetical protein